MAKIETTQGLTPLFRACLVQGGIDSSEEGEKGSRASGHRPLIQGAGQEQVLHFANPARRFPILHTRIQQSVHSRIEQSVNDHYTRRSVEEHGAVPATLSRPNLAFHIYPTTRVFPHRVLGSSHAQYFAGRPTAFAR